MSKQYRKLPEKRRINIDYKKPFPVPKIKPIDISHIVEKPLKQIINVTNIAYKERKISFDGNFIQKIFQKTINDIMYLGKILPLVYAKEEGSISLFKSKLISMNKIEGSKRFNNIKINKEDYFNMSRKANFKPCNFITLGFLKQLHMG